MNKVKENKGVTLVALMVAFAILVILTGITIGTVLDRKGILQQGNATINQAKRESLIQKIQADLYTSKVKNGETANEQDLIDLINENNYGTVEEKDGENVLINVDEENGIEIEIPFSEILGWEK